MQKILIGLSVLFFSQLQADGSLIEQRLKQKIARISPHSSRHLARLTAAKMLAQNEIDAARTQRRSPSWLAQQVVAIQPSQTRTMWEKIALLQASIKASC